MIFEILKNPIYTYLFILTLVIFLVIFIWRKLTILESNFYILEKRVNLMKDSSRQNNNITPGNISQKPPVSSNEIFTNITEKKLERSNIVMNEIFGNAPKKCKKEDVKITFNSPEVNTCQEDETDIPEILIDNITFDNTSQENSKEPQNVELNQNIDVSVNFDDIQENTEFENTSNASEFIFNSEEKYTQKKLSKLNMEKLKSICEKMNISSEGNKNQLISRILE